MKTPNARKVALGLTLAATALAGTAAAAHAMHGGKEMTRAEAQTHSAQMFARMDANKDGKLDQADREARRAALFDRLDTDKNGQISRDEFNARPQRPEGHAMHGPGREGGMRHGHGMRGHGRHAMMMGRMADANKDGAVTQAEFTAAALQRFDRMDANRDGKVTREERQAARKAMREAWKANKPAAPAE